MNIKKNIENLHDLDIFSVLLILYTNQLHMRPFSNVFITKYGRQIKLEVPSV